VCFLEYNKRESPAASGGEQVVYPQILPHASREQDAQGQVAQPQQRTSSTAIFICGDYHIDVLL